MVQSINKSVEQQAPIVSYVKKSPSCDKLGVTLRSKLILMLNTPTVQDCEQLFPPNDVTVTKPHFPFRNSVL
jgi:hypothetical protein